MPTEIADTVQRPQEFLLSEGPGTLSRERGVLASGQSAAETKDGRVLKDNGAGKLVVAAGTNTGGVSSEPIVGILIGNVDASAGDRDVAYISRIAEVKSDGIRMHAVTGGGQANADLAVKNALLARHIVTRVTG